MYFFFSSRRRHTRFDCDWSSDVCSSDLGHLSTSHSLRERKLEDRTVDRRPEILQGLRLVRCGADLRSEEHTSELQSQSNLVCRLLLEKNTNNATLTPVAAPVPSTSALYP